MEKSKKKRCWSCKSLDVIKWGKQGSNEIFVGEVKNLNLCFKNRDPNDNTR